MRQAPRSLMIFLALTLCLGLAGCAATPATTTLVSTTIVVTNPREIVFDFDFNGSSQGWTAGFADLPAQYDPSIYELDSRMAALPAELGLQGQGLMIAGHNRSDDLFMFIKRKLDQADGIEPLRTYEIVFGLEFATSAAAGSVGIGGSPSESVYVKAGAAPLEPAAVREIQDGEAMLVLNVDKGQQIAGGKNAVMIGNVAKTNGSDDGSFALKSLSGADFPLLACSSAEGVIWIFAGTDSGFEGKTVLYYTRIKAVLVDRGPCGQNGK